MDNYKQTAEKILSISDVKINGNRDWDLIVNNDKFFERTIKNGSLGFGESYMDGWWDCKKLDEMLTRLFRAKLQHVIIPFSAFLHIAKSRVLNLQTKKGSKAVAELHYDLGNEFYSNMLDKRMQYTCAYWDWGAKNLDQAQEDKLDLVCKKLQLKKGEKVLELGCGWGQFAKFAAQKYKVNVTSYNISKEQVEYARESCKGLSVKIVHEDYRNATGSYDKIVSIGMCEHVGYKNFRNFYKLQHELVKDNGLVLTHTIGGNVSVTNTDPWIQEYIFPNSMLPSIKQLSESFEGLFVMEDWHNLNVNYDKTLMEWDKNFRKNWHKFKDQYGERFYRMWRFYLLSSAAQFRARKIQLWQIVLSKDGLPSGYKSIR
ncbi:cyclopropane fatty acyl phospholipid synthase [Candidatus Woesearchaeota archaeon]|nr:cyclopropane fatty acyl phospholipid synthase [Candidatus Woesearchaeota archaeon]